MRTFYIHDNGGRPFKVRVNKSHLSVYADVKEEDGPPAYDRLVYQTDFTKLYIGEDPDEPDFRGNSLLALIADNRYVWIGMKIYEFSPVDTITDFYSPVGNSDVPYPYAVGDKYTYLLIACKYLDNKHIPKKEDPYNVYYASTWIQDRLQGRRWPKGKGPELSAKERQTLQAKLEHALRIRRSAKNLKFKVKVKRLYD